MAQGGNVQEWEETEMDQVNDSSSSLRGIRGGAWITGSGVLASSVLANGLPTFTASSIGFRVASSIPEPSTLLLLCFGSLAVLGTRKGR